MMLIMQTNEDHEVTLRREGTLGFLSGILIVATAGMIRLCGAICRRDRAQVHKACPELARVRKYDASVRHFGATSNEATNAQLDEGFSPLAVQAGRCSGYRGFAAAICSECDVSQGVIDKHPQTASVALRHGRAKNLPDCFATIIVWAAILWLVGDFRYVTEGSD